MWLFSPCWTWIWVDLLGCRGDLRFSHSLRVAPVKFCWIPCGVTRGNGELFLFYGWAGSSWKRVCSPALHLLDHTPPAKGSDVWPRLSTEVFHLPRASSEMCLHGYGGKLQLVCITWNSDSHLQRDEVARSIKLFLSAWNTPFLIIFFLSKGVFWSGEGAPLLLNTPGVIYIKLLCWHKKRFTVTACLLSK